MQRLGIRRASGPECASGLGSDEATPETLANLRCTFLNHSTCSHDYRLKMTKGHEHATNITRQPRHDRNEMRRRC